MEFSSPSYRAHFFFQQAWVRVSILGFECLFYSKAGEPGVRSTDGSCADLHVNYETTSYGLRAWKNSLNFHLSNGKAYSLPESTAVKKEVRLISSGSSKQSIYTSWKMFLKLFFKRTGRFISTARKEEDTYLWYYNTPEIKIYPTANSIS